MGKLRCQITLEGPGLDLRVVRFEWREALSTLFVAEVLLEAPDAELELQDLLFTPAALRLFDDDQVARVFHGVIEQAGYLGEYRHGVYHYRLRLQPQIHALAYRVRSRIFQDKDVKAIVSEVLQGAGLPDEAFEWRTEHPTYPVREYCTQYKESELAFVLRLLAEEGIFFYFEHDELGHRMCFDDRADAHLPVEPEVLYADHTRAASRELATELRFRSELTHDAYLMRDWDFMSPAEPVEAAQSDAGTLGLSFYEYPGGFVDPVDGGRHTDDRLRAQALQKYLLTGRSNHLGFAPGKLFTLDGARPGFLNRGFLLLQCVHLYEERGAEATADERDLALSTRFRATHDDVIYRPLPLPKPKVFGVESAVITSAGEEIHVDEWGRVKLHMHWDREDPVDDTASCWVRVQQQNLSGSMLLPRIGWEVAVGFIDGDPDRPLVLQKLYNRETMPPYPLPANLSQAALQSASSPGGGGTNELRLQDASGAQGFALHAQRDMVLGVGNDSHETIALNLEESYGATLDCIIGIDETVSIGGNQQLTVQGNDASQTGADKTISIGALDDLSVKATYSTHVNGDRSETIAASQTVRAVSMAESFGANHKQSVGAALALTAAETVSEAVAGNKQLAIGGAYLIKATGAFGESAGKAKLLTAGATSYQSKGGLALKAKGLLGMKIGGALVEKVKGNYAVSGKQVSVDAPDGAQIEGGGTKLTLKDGKLELDGSKFGAKAGPMLMLKGKISYR